VDGKADERPFRGAVERAADGVAFLPARRPLRWGGFGIVEATLAALDHATRFARGEHYVLLSGADYPIKPRPALVDALSEGAVHMDVWPIPRSDRDPRSKRLERYYFAPSRRDSRRYAALNAVVAMALPKRDVSRGLGGRRPYGGSQWWALSHDWAVRVLDVVTAEPDLVRFFRRSRIPDEMFFQTIVQGLPGGDRTIRPSLTYVDWTRREWRGSPATLTSADVPALASTDACFARKFDLDLDPGVFTEIDRLLLRR
jgi:hypothetical protein